MKKIFTIFLIVSCLIGTKSLAQITWTNDGGDNLWSNSDNWDSGTVPIATDQVIFDGDFDFDCIVDETVITVSSITINSGFTSLIYNDGANVSFVVQNGINQSGGVFEGNTFPSIIISAGNLNILGGSFTSPTTLTVVGNITISGSVTDFSGSTLNINISAANRSINAVGVEFENITLTNTGNTTLIINRVLTFNSNTTINGKLTITTNNTNTGVRSTTLNSNTIFLKGDLQVSGTSPAQNSPGTTTIVLNGDNTQLIQGVTTTTPGIHRLPNIIINKTLGAVSISNNISFGGNFTVNDVDDILVNTSVVNFYGTTITSDPLSTTPARFFDLVTRSNFTQTSKIDVNRNLIIPTGFTFNSNDSLFIGGVIADTGTFNIGLTSTIVLDGTGTYTMNKSRLFNNLVINKSGGMTVGATAADTVWMRGFLTINAGTVTTNNKLYLVSNASGTASLIDNASTAGGGGSVSGNVVVQRFTPSTPLRAYYYGLPVAGTLSQLWGSSNLRMLRFDEAKPTANTKLDLWTSLTNKNTVAQTGRGYVKYHAGETNTVSGLVHNGTINYPITFTTNHATVWGADTSGFNFVGNPYPSAINWNAASGWTKTNMDATIYMWNGTQYATWNGSVGTNGATNGVIGSMQGFFVKANGAGALTSTNAVRVTGAGSNNNFYRTAVPAKISVSVSANNLSDETVLVLNDEADMNFESDKDGFKLAGINEAPMLATKSADNKLLSINAIPNPASETEIPVVFRAGFNGQHRLNVSGTEHVGTGGEMYLVDSKDAVVHDLIAEPEYLFTADSADASDADRFKIVFRTSGTTDLSTMVKRAGILVHAFDASLFVKFQHVESATASVAVYDITGRSVYANNAVSTDKDLQINLSGVQQGIYIVNVIAGSTVVRKKVVLK